MAEEPTIEELREQIHSLEEQIRDRTRVYNEKVGDQQITHEAAEAALQQAETTLAEAQDELRGVEQEKETIRPQYERCQQNKDQHAKAEAYRRDISTAEDELKEADTKIKHLESRLQIVSTTYKTERERRSLLVSRVSNLVEELGKAVEEKIALTFPIDEVEGGPRASVCLQRLSEMSRERELEIDRWTRHGQELSEIINLKKQRATELRLEGQRQMQLTVAAKDEEIKSMVLRFNEERHSLQQDIESIKEVNAEQLRTLHRPKVAATKDVTLSDRSQPQRRDLAAPTSKVFVQRTTDLEKEKEVLVEKLRLTAAEKHKLIRATQDLRRQIDVEDKKFTAALRNLENQILNERHQITELEHDNEKLEEACESLKVAIRSS
jgi:chromosome segregation ATPase